MQSLGLGELTEGRDLIADDRGLIARRLRHWADIERCALVLTSGGTGVAPSDVTPEATLSGDRSARSPASARRCATPRASTRATGCSRARVAGIRGACLIVNFPGSPASIAQTGAAVAGALPHALALIAGERPAHD